jgi:hypothetical protein
MPSSPGLGLPFDKFLVDSLSLNLPLSAAVLQPIARSRGATGSQC